MNSTPILYCRFWNVMIRIYQTFYPFVFVNSPKKNNNVQELEEPLRQLVTKQDSIAHAVNAFIEKYEPVIVESKSYNNSSFFRANNVDSVEVKVFGNK